MSIISVYGTHINKVKPISIMSVNAYNIIEHFKIEAMLGRYTSRLLSKLYLVLGCKINPMFILYAKYEYNVS